jgi:EAL domain-containing protein (putative c-di-GMP-specific phosphodiesterase class I)
VHRLRAAVGRQADLADIAPPPRSCPGILWLEVEGVATVLDHRGTVTELTWFGDVGCRINANDLATSRSSIAALAETGIAFVVLEAAVMRLARSDLATAIMTRSFTRRAHINGMAVVAESSSAWTAAERAADLGVDLLVERTPHPLDGAVDREP